MAELIRVEPEVVRANLARVRERAGEAVRILVATKYVADDDLPALAEAGVELVGENRLQDLERKQALHGDLFEWHFIGGLQSRKVRAIVPRVRLIHSRLHGLGAREAGRAGSAGDRGAGAGERRGRGEQGGSRD